MPKQISSKAMLKVMQEHVASIHAGKDNEIQKSTSSRQRRVKKNG